MPNNRTIRYNRTANYRERHKQYTPARTSSPLHKFVIKPLILKLAKATAADALAHESLTLFIRI